MEQLPSRVPTRLAGSLDTVVCVLRIEYLTGPQHIEQVHNPEYLNDTAISSMVRDHDIRLLAISPHVGNYARQILEEQGVQVLRGQRLARLGLACMRWQRVCCSRL